MPYETNPWQTVWTVLALVAVLVLCYIVTKFLASRSSLGGAGMRSAYMRVIDRIVIARDKYILLVEIGGEVFILGVTGHGISALGTVKDLTELPRPENAVGSFMDSLRALGARRAKNKAEPAHSVEEYIQDPEEFEAILSNRTMRNMAKDTGDFAAQLDDMDKKMRRRESKIKSRRDGE